MRIMTRNVIEENTSITMTNEDVNYPIEALYSNILEEIVQASGNNTLFTISFDEDKIIDSIFFGFHNASNVTFVFKDSGGGILDTVVFTNPEVNAKEYITQLTIVRSIEVTLTTGETYLLIGNISCGQYTQLHNIRLPMLVEHIDTSIFAQTNGAQFLYRTGITVQSFNVDCDKITDSWFDNFKDAYAYVHKGKTWWMDRTEEQDKQIFGAFDANYHSTRVNTLTDLSFSFKEGR